MKKHTKARRRRYRTAQERLTRDRRQAQQVTKALQQASMTWDCLKTS
jgi:hypothetical protein